MSTLGPSDEEVVRQGIAYAEDILGGTVHAVWEAGWHLVMAQTIRILADPSARVPVVRNNPRLSD